MEGTTKIKEGPLILEFYTELRMGFTLYEMTLAGKKLKKNVLHVLYYLLSNKNRTFFNKYLFSESSRYIVIPEYVPFLIKSGYKTCLVIFDLEEKRETHVSCVENGSIIPLAFEDTSSDRQIVYHKYIGGFTREFVHEISKLKNWKKF